MLPGEDENPYRLLIKESLVIQAYKPALNCITYPALLIVLPDGLSKDVLPELIR
jgi:hypothetical protein